MNWDAPKVMVFLEESHSHGCKLGYPPDIEMEITILADMDLQPSEPSGPGDGQVAGEGPATLRR